ncbi:MAG: benzoate-CoA ligase family protein [Rhodospirillales bacterium]
MQAADLCAAEAGWLDLPESYNAASHFIDRHLTEGRGDKTAFIDAAGSHSYADLAAGVAAFAGALGELGLKQESRIALCLLDSIDFPVCFWGAIKAGVVPVALNTLLTAETYHHILKDCGAEVLVVSRALLPVLAPVLADLPALRSVVVSGGVEPRSQIDLPTHDLELLLDAAVPRETAAATHGDDVAFWLYSSGSTGAPKGVRHLHRNLPATVEFYAKPVLGIREDDVVFSAAKLFFAYGLGNGMTFPLGVGATAVLLAERPTPQAVMATLADHQPTIFYGVPTLFAAILGDLAYGRESSSARLRICVSAGEALPEDIGKRWEDRYGVAILDGVGSTEMLHIYLSNRQGEIRYGTSGRPVPGYQVRLVDEAGDSVEAGGVGELLVAGPSVCEGYWRRRERSLDTFVGRWMRTGDKYTRDAEGYYIYCGRGDDMFKSGGNWVSPFEVESALIAHPEVLEAGVIGRLDESGNLKPKAFVVLNSGRQGSEDLAAALQAFVKARIEIWKYPRWIAFVESLPKTATGKVQRFKLREMDGA